MPKPAEAVHEFAGRSGYMDHLFTDWSLSGPSEVEPDRIVEESVSARGKRRTRSTYVLEEPRLEAFGAPMGRAFTRRASGKALRRLARRLA